MSYQNFIPQLWSGILMAAAQKELVYGSPAMANTDYEGQIQQQGDSVNILTIGNPTVKKYVDGTTTVTPEKLDTSSKTLVITESDYFAVEISDVDKAQTLASVKGGLMQRVSEGGGYAMADTCDQFMAGLYTGVASANQLGTSQCTTATQAYTILRKLALKLDEAKVPANQRYCTAAPWFWSLLMEDSRFTSAANRGDGGATLRSGWIGDLPALGLKAMKSLNAPNVTGDDYVVQAGVPQAASFAMQLTQIEAYRPQSSFSDAVKGLQLYGGKLVRPDWIATAYASQT